MITNVTPQKKLVSCSGKDTCSDCRIGPNGLNLCNGCLTHGHRDSCSMESCHQSCSTCSGHNVEVAATCTKSLQRDSFLERVLRADTLDDQYKSYTFSPRPPIKSSNKAIVTVAGSVPRQGKSSEIWHPKVDLIALNYAYVNSSAQRWLSDDLREWYKIPKKARLILNTQMYDDVLEKVYEIDNHDEKDFMSVGFDYWMPFDYSMYWDEALMMQSYNFLRTLESVDKHKAWFATVPATFLKLNTLEACKRMYQQIGNIILAAQWVEDDLVLKSVIASLHKINLLAPKDTSIFVAGATSPKLIFNVTKTFPNRDFYFFSTMPMLLARKGIYMTPGGKADRGRGRDMNLLELSYENQGNYFALVDKCIRMASSKKT